MVDKGVKVSLESLEPKNASIWKRVNAYIIDSFIISFVTSIPFFYTYKSVTGEMPFLEILWVTPLVIAYFTILEKWYGASLGKMLLKIKVRSFNGDLEWQQTIIRNLFKFSPTLMLIDTINCFLNKKNQRFTEVLAKTRVIKK